MTPVGGLFRLPVTRRFAIVLVCAALMSAACGHPTANGPVIGVRPLVNEGAAASEFDVTSISNALSNQLSLVNDASAIPGENKIAKGELPIDSTLTVKQSARLGALQQLGQILVDNRLAAIAAVRRQVLADPLMSAGEKAQLTYLLDRATADLNAMQVKIARGLLVDQARAEVTGVAAFRVYGLLVPQVHLLIAAYQTQHLVSIYSSQQSTLQQQINTKGAAGGQTGHAQLAINDLSAQIAIMSRDSWYALAVLPGLTAAGYPGNKQVLANARHDLNAAGNAGSVAASDVILAKADLAV